MEWSNAIYQDRHGSTVLDEDQLVDQGRDGQNKFCIRNRFKRNL
jgi:hypothetical protein